MRKSFLALALLIAAGCAGQSGSALSATSNASAQSIIPATPKPDLIGSGVGGGSASVTISIPSPGPIACAPAGSVVTVVVAGSPTPPPCP